MDEVMDASSDVMDYTTTLPKPKRNGKTKSMVLEYFKHPKLFKWRVCFGIVMGLQTKKKHRFISDLTKEHNLSFIAISETSRKSFTSLVLKNLVWREFSTIWIQYQVLIYESVTHIYAWKYASNIYTHMKKRLLARMHVRMCAFSSIWMHGAWVSMAPYLMYTFGLISGWFKFYSFINIWSHVVACA